MRLQHEARVVAVAGLGGTALIHALWAAGADWPARDREGLADLVYGSHPFPGTAATTAVAATLVAATGLVAVRSGLISRASGWRDSALVRYGSRAVAAALATRGAAGVVASGLSMGDWSERYRHWDLRLYSPLCLGLAVAVIVAETRQIQGRSS